MSIVRPHSDDLAPHDLIDRDFEVLELAGRGSFSTVYRAVQRSRKNRPVALKVLHWGIQQELERRNDTPSNPYLTEQALVARLSHPAVCRVYKIGRSFDGRWYAAVEWVDGETLEDMMRRHRDGLPLALAAELVTQLGSALSEIHRLQVVHRDLKPSNLMVSPCRELPGGFRLRILDFGLARLAGEEDEMNGTGGLLVGTPAYMSPEQARGGPTDPRSDIFSLAAISFELLTGKRHIQIDERRTGADGYIEYLTSKAPLPTVAATRLRSDLPEDVDDILAQGLARGRYTRPPTVEMFCDDLEVMLRAHAPLRRRATMFERAWQKLRGKPAGR